MQFWSGRFPYYFVGESSVLVHNDCGNPINPKKVSTSFLEKKGIDAHQLKYDTLGSRAEISRYNIFKDKSGGLWLQKNGAKDFIPTYEFIN